MSKKFQLSFLALLALLAIVLVPLLSAAQAEPEETVYMRQWGKSALKERQRTGSPGVILALSGGSSRGLAHIGVLRAFAESEVKISGIAGSSMGGVIGGLYCSGYSPEWIADLAREIDFASVFSNRPDRGALFLTQKERIDRTFLSLRFNSWKPSIPTELSSAQKITELLSLVTMRANYSSENFLNLPTPFSTIATDIASGESVILQQGNLSEALRATMAFPLAISAVNLNGRRLMDGGMLMPVPVALARSMSHKGEIVVAVNTTRALKSKDSISDPIEMINQVSTVMSMRELREQLALADYVITPKTRSESGANFREIEAMIDAGYSSAQPIISQLVNKHRELQQSRLFIIDSCRTTSADQETNSLCRMLTGQTSPFNERELDSIFAQFWEREPLALLSVNGKALSVDSQGVTHLLITVNSIVTPPMERLNLTIRCESSDLHDSLVPQVREYLQTVQRLNLDELAKWITTWYETQGLDLAVVRSCVYDPAALSLTIEIDEARVSEFYVKGLLRTKGSFLRDRIDVTPGKPFTLKTARHAYRDIYGSELFRRVSVGLAPGDSGAVVNLSIEERASAQMNFGYHWNDEYHSEGLLEIQENNFFGIGLQLGAELAIAERRRRLELRAHMDRIFRTYVTFDLRASQRELERAIFSSDGKQLGLRKDERYGLSLSVGQHIARFGIVSLAISVEHVKSRSTLTPAIESYDLRTLKLSSHVEDLDRTYFPRVGRRSEISLETAGKVFGGATEFAKWFGSFESFFPLSKRVNFHPLLRIASSRTNLPAPEKFYLGGLGMFEGFRSDELTGEKMFLLSLELRYQALSRVYFSGKYNTGNVYGRIEDITSDNQRHGWAALAGVDTPLGPIIFGYGRASEGHDRVYFQAGLRF